MGTFQKGILNGIGKIILEDVFYIGLLKNKLFHDKGVFFNLKENTWIGGRWS